MLPKSIRKPFLLFALAITSGTWAVRSGPVPTFEYQIVSVTNTGPGQLPVITFAVKDPASGTSYDIKNHPAFTSTANGASRLFLQLGWDTRDYTNTGSGSELAPVGAGAALPIALNALTTSIPLGDGTFRVTSNRPIPATATGTGVAAIEGHPAGQDAAGAWTLRVPVKSAFRNFAITGTTIAARRKVVDVVKCNKCHGQLTLHGNNRTDEPQVCVICHNPNATDVPYRQPADGPEVSIDFKRMVHSIHSASIRKTPFVVIGFNHSVNDFSKVRFPARLRDCMNCHVDNTFELPLTPSALGSTIFTNSVITLPKNIVNSDPNDDLNITPTAAVCSSCHDDRETRRHMERNGGNFSVLQSAIASGQVRERCVNCHGPGKEKSVRKVHLSDDDD